MGESAQQRSWQEVKMGKNKDLYDIHEQLNHTSPETWRIFDDPVTEAKRSPHCESQFIFSITYATESAMWVYAIPMNLYRDSSN